MECIPTLKLYRDAREFLTPHSSSTNPLCIICFRERELDFSTERNTRSHIIPNSVLHAFDGGETGARLELVQSKVISYVDFSYKAFCKHRRDGEFRSCEDCLNQLGEEALPAFVTHFVGSNRFNSAPVQFNDTKIFHAIATIGWRILALSGFGDSTCASAVFNCLEYIRPFVRDSAINVDEKFAVMLHVVGQKTEDAWIELMGRGGVNSTNREAVVAPLNGTVSPGLKVVHYEYSGARFIHWNAVLGPLHIKYIFLDSCTQVGLTVGGIIGALAGSSQRIPSTGLFQIQGFEDRPAMAKDMLAADVVLPLARAYSLAFRSQPYHWLQQFSDVEVLVRDNFGSFDGDVDTIVVAESPYRTLVGNYNVDAHAWNRKISECRIYQVGRAVILFAVFHTMSGTGRVKKVICASKITRSAAQKYADLEAIHSAHREHLTPHKDLLLGMLRHLDPLCDAQLPLPRK
jgi:hypothetical protein